MQQVVKLAAEHGAVCALETEYLGYFGWPSVARMDDGTLVAVASGLRAAHVCPFGRTTIAFSRDEGATWTFPQVVNDGPLDDRDAGVVCLGGARLLVSWFCSDTRKYYNAERVAAMESPARERVAAGLARMDDETVARWIGAWVRTSDDGGETWNLPVRVPLNSPHGPIRLHDGALLYFGKTFFASMERFSIGEGSILAMRSTDDGATWQSPGIVSLLEGTIEGNYHEAHAVELPSGKLIGVIRVQESGSDHLARAGVLPFSIAQTESDDGGRTWSPLRFLGFHGSPPHIMRHSSGTLVLSYGYRQPPYGERIALSDDEGRTWHHDFVLRDDGLDGDLGYPATVELSDGRLLTVYYQKPYRVEDRCALLYSRWRLP